MFLVKKKEEKTSISSQFESICFRERERKKKHTQQFSPGWFIKCVIEYYSHYQFFLDSCYLIQRINGTIDECESLTFIEDKRRGKRIKEVLKKKEEHCIPEGGQLEDSKCVLCAPA